MTPGPPVACVLERLQPWPVIEVRLMPDHVANRINI